MKPTELLTGDQGSDVHGGPLFPQTRPAHWTTVNRSSGKLTIELYLVATYLVATGIADLQASKIGVMVGPVPVFLTDITLFLLLLSSLIRRPSRILYWAVDGSGAGSVGQAIWLTVCLSIAFFSLAVKDYLLFALRDLAIFSYGVYFPLVYFAIRDRYDAVTVMRCYVYASVIGAALLVMQETVGLDLGLFHPMARVALGRKFVALRSGDSNAPVFALVFLWVFALFESRGRILNVISAILCCFSLTASAARASVVAIALAGAVTCSCVRRKQRACFALIGAVAALSVMLAPMMPESRASQQLDNLRLTVMSAAGGPSIDGDASFRTRRWQYAIDQWFEHPIFGIGFGRQIIPMGLVDATERKGEFNVGMPHNSFLFVGARTGLLGLSLILYSWLSTLTRLILKARQSSRMECLAVANMLAAMLGCAMFGLFIERPGSNATFWIVLAVGSRLVNL